MYLLLSLAIVGEQGDQEQNQRAGWLLSHLKNQLPAGVNVGRPETYRESAEGLALLATSFEEADPCDMAKKNLLKEADDTGSSSNLSCAPPLLS